MQYKKEKKKWDQLDVLAKSSAKWPSSLGMNEREAEARALCKKMG